MKKNFSQALGGGRAPPPNEGFVSLSYTCRHSLALRISAPVSAPSPGLPTTTRAPRPFGERRSETQPQLRSKRMQAQSASHSDDALAALSTGAVFLPKQPQLCLICLDFLECALERGGTCVHLPLLPAVQVRFCRSCQLLAYARGAEALLVQVAKP